MQEEALKLLRDKEQQCLWVDDCRVRRLGVGRPRGTASKRKGRSLYVSCGEVPETLTDLRERVVQHSCDRPIA